MNAHNANSPPPQRPRSLEEVHRSVTLPRVQGPLRWWRRLLSFSGPAYMVSVGYMDPGNWATDLEGGARFGYTLIWILLLSNLMAVLLQTLSARLGLVTGRDLAQACREDYPPAVRWVLFGLCEVAIAACDLAEVLGTAIALNLLFGIPLVAAVVITGFDVMLLLAIQRWGIRRMEGLIILLVFAIGLCFIFELFLSQPSLGGIASGFVPRPLTGAQLYVAIGMLGATVMPHNLYLHSALVQSRNVSRSQGGIAQACRYNLIDSAVALNAAFFVNAAILIVSAATFWRHGIEVTEIQQAHNLLEGVLGTTLAPVAFALALLCAGQSSTLTGTLAGQITMEGFLQLRMRPWLRRLITRMLAVVPAVIVIAMTGDQGTYKLLILSQVILSLQLPFAVVPLVRFTSSRMKMGPFANPLWVKIVAWLAAGLIVALNAKLVYEQISEWLASAGAWRPVILFVVAPAAMGLGALLLWMTLRRREQAGGAGMPDAAAITERALRGAQKYARIGVAVEAGPDDAQMLAEAVALARIHGAELVLMHVVEGVGGQWYGQQTDDAERRHDEEYMRKLAEQLQSKSLEQGLRGVRTVLGYGQVPTELARLAGEQKLDLIVLGGHGHRRLADLFRGETITGVRHGVSIPLLAVRKRGN